MITRQAKVGFWLVLAFIAVSLVLSVAAKFSLEHTHQLRSEVNEALHPTER